MSSGRKAQNAIEKSVKDKEECMQKLQRAWEAFANYKGIDENPPEKKVVQNATTAIAHNTANELLVRPLFLLVKLLAINFHLQNC